MALPTDTSVPLYWHDGQPIVAFLKGASDVGSPTYWHDGQPIFINLVYTEPPPAPPNTGPSNSYLTNFGIFPCNIRSQRSI